MMLCDKMIDCLNKQINLEFYSSNLYLQMSAWASDKGLDGAATFLEAHAAEEMMHMKRLFDYMIECGALPRLGAIEGPPTSFDNVKVLFEKILEHEILVTRAINELVHTSFEQKDYSTFNFLQWYVAEQHEEETLFKGILDKIDIIGTEGQGLFMIDQELSKLIAAQAAKPAEGASAN